MTSPHPFFLFFFFNDTATTEIYTLSLHDALPISLNFTWPAFFKIFDPDPSPSPISDGDSLVKDCHKRPLRDVSLRIEETTIDDDVLPKLREIQATVNLIIVAGGIPLVI